MGKSRVEGGRNCPCRRTFVDERQHTQHKQPMSWQRSEARRGMNAVAHAQLSVTQLEFAL